MQHSRILRVLAGFCLIAAGVGCTQGSRDRVSQLPIADRLRATYPDLQSNGFAVIADFEVAEQAEHFQLQGESSAVAAPVVLPAEGVEQTGGGCLAFTLGGPTELVANNRDDVAGLLPRDWTPYNLLLMNVAVDQNATLEIGIVGASAEYETRSVCLLPLDAGWNPLRLDLKEAGEQTPLDNIRELRMRMLEPESAVQVKLDDMVLANNRSVLFGDPNGASGDLYVVREGRHTMVGACGRFELGFLNGQIVRWHALDTDPMRLTNLVGADNVLGPIPVKLNVGDLERQIRAGELPIGVRTSDRMIAARQRVVEAHEARIVLECEWMPAAETEADFAEATIRWTFAIYPTGDVYVTVESRGENEGENLGLAVSRVPVPDLTAHVEDVNPSAGACYGALSGAQSGCLLFVPRDAEAFSSMRVVRDPLHPRVSLLAHGRASGASPAAACLISVWPPSNCEPPRQGTIAKSFASPPAMEFLIGDLDRGTDGDLDADGFNERFGAFALAMHENRVHVRLDGNKLALHQPVFFIPASAGKEVWVYVDHLILSDLHRDNDQNVMFQLPYTIDRALVIEVYVRGGGG